MNAKQLFGAVILFSLQCLAPYAIAQVKQITGRVTEREDGSVLAGASVTSAGGIITLTDTGGKFKILVSAYDRVLYISHIGFVSREIDITKQTDFDISLVSKIASLDEAIVTGYGTSKRKDITGAVSRLSVSEFNRGVINNPLQQAQSKIAGVVITPNGGDPNGDFTVRIRGATSLEGQPPLLVINGVAIDDFQKAINRLNPADVESFDILKDASAAAIYGARGGNGVIIVTTKHGKAGKLALGYDAFVGVEKISKKLKVMNAEEWRNATRPGGASLDKWANTDWQDELTRPALSHSHTISLNGGNDEMKFYGSAAYSRHEGIIKNTAKELFSVRLVADQNSLSNRLKATYDINNTVIKRDFLPDQISTSQARNTGTFFFENVLQRIPVIPEYNLDGTYYQSPDGSLNPVKLVNTVYSKLRENFFQASAKADYELIQGLNAGILGAISRGNDLYDFFDGNAPTAYASKKLSTKQLFSGDVHANYKRQLGKQSIDITGTYEYNKFENDGFGITASGFIVPGLLNNNLGTATTILRDGTTSFKNEVKIISFLGRAVYTYDERFIVTANFRRDGSSKFGPGNRWGNFPSIAVAWRINNEDFLSDAYRLSNLKLRMSYGWTGNQENLPSNAYRLLYGGGGTYLYDGQFLQSYSVSQENNPDLKWEVRKSFNAGLDIALWNDRLNATVDVFRDKTSDMLYLYGVPQPPFLTNQVYANAASAINRGVEVTVNASILNGQTFSWNIQANVGSIRNRITNLTGKFRGTDLNISDPRYGYAYGRGLSGAYVSKLEVGYPVGVLWLPQHAGFDKNGNELYKNYDDNGKLTDTSLAYNDKDRVYIDPTAHYSWGLNNNFRYKKFELNFFVRGVYGQKIFANSLMNLQSAVLLPSSNVMPDALTNGFANQPQPSDYWVRSGSFIRLENITLQYDFSKRKPFNGMNLYVTATNLLVITKYKGVDPEVRVEGSQRYIDVNYYPKTKSVCIGVNLEL